MAQQRLRILVVDDDDVMRRVLIAVFARVADTTLASSAAEARALLDSVHPDLVLSDEGMPGESGLTFLAGVARTHPRVRRVLFSAAEPPDLLALLRDGTLHGFLQKPATVDELLALVAESSLVGAGEGR